MLALFTASCKIPKSTDPGSILTQIQAGLRDGGVACGRIRFLISHEDSRVIERITKAEPVLASYRGEALAHASKLSGTIDPRTDNEIFSALCRIATGVARRFRPRAFSVVFAGLDWGPAWLAELPGSLAGTLEQAEAMLAPLGVVADLSSSVAYSNSWWVNGRNQSVSIRLIAQAPEDTGKAITVGDEVLSVLNRFVKVNAKRFTLSVLPGAEREGEHETGPEASADRVVVSAEGPRRDSADAAQKKRTLQTAAAAHMHELCSSGRLPHVLETPTITASAERETRIPKKQIISKALRPLGYRHIGKFGGQGVMCFGKVTSANTKLLVEFDFGTWLPRIEAVLRVSGSTWTASMPVIFRESTGSASRPYTPATKEAFSRAVDNIAFILTELETVFVAPLEAEFGSSPSWTATF